MMRLMSSKVKSCERPPTRLPIVSKISTQTPSFLVPRDLRMKALGIARMTPAKINTEVSHETAVRLTFKSLATTAMIGAILNWFRPMASPLR
jgi:hypothetical protein